MFIPRLRPEIELVRDEDADDLVVALRDPIFDRTIHLGDVSRAIVLALDGRDWPAIRAALARPPDDLDRQLRRLMFLGVLGPSPVVRTQLVVLPDTRFECRGSGACCRDHKLGPLSDEDVALLARLDLESHFGPGPYHQDGYLVQSNGACRFLEDNRCGLHARFGAEQKPRFCRMFPFEELPTIDGVRFYDKGACSCFAVAAGPNAPPAPPPPPGPTRGRYHPVVRLDDRTFVDYALYLRFTDAAIAAVDSQPPAAALAAIAAALPTYRDALLACPLAADEPLATATSFVWPAPAPTPAPDPDAAEAFTLVLSDLIETLETIDPSVGLGPPLLSDAVALFRTGYRLAARTADPTYPLSADEEKMRAVAAPPEIDDVLRLSLRQQLFGYRSLMADRPLPALARMALLLLAATWSARRAAVTRGDAHMAAADLSAGHSLAARVLETAATSSVFLQYEDLLPAVLQAIPHLT